MKSKLVLVSLLLAATLLGQQPFQSPIYVPIGGSGGGGGTPGGVSGDLQYNNAGAFGGYTPASGIIAWIENPSSANLIAALTDSSGTAGHAVFSVSPTLTGTTTFSGAAGGTIDFGGSTGSNTISNSGGVVVNVSANIELSGTVADNTGATTSTTGQYPSATSGGKILWHNTTESYWMSLSTPSGSLAQNTTYYYGVFTNNTANVAAGRYKAYIPKSGTITTVIFNGYWAGGAAAQTVNIYLYKNGSQQASTNMQVIANDNIDFKAVTGLSIPVTGVSASSGTISAGDYIEFVVVCPATMTGITTFNATMQVLVEQVTNNQ